MEFCVRYLSITWLVTELLNSSFFCLLIFLYIFGFNLCTIISVLASKKIKKKESSYLVESKLFSFAKDLFRQFSWLHYLPISLCHSLVKLRYTGLECSFIKVFMRLFSSEFIFYFYQCSSRTNAILRRKLHLR